ncbi:MAG: hypothetical protein ACWA40_09965 [Planktomarina sp.]
MKLLKLSSALILAFAVSACTGLDTDTRGPDKSRDLQNDNKDLSELIAGIWVDPNGCDHWIIDDGTEGYLSSRLDRNGKPVCTGHGAETIVYGPYQEGSTYNKRTEGR